MENPTRPPEETTPAPPAAPPAPVTEAAYADPATVLVIPRAFFNYVVIAIAFFALGALVTYLTMTGLFNANSEENQAIVFNAVSTVQANIVAANPTEDPGLVEGSIYETITVDDDPAIGPENAPVTMIEFSDFRCPFCGRYALETFPLLQANYGDRVRFVYRDLPILGQASQIAAIAGHCASEQNKFWEFHEWAFAHQQEFSPEAFDAWATSEGLDVTVFNTCIDTQSESPEFVADYQAVAALTGRLGTPMFFINGEFISGAQPYQVFAEAIDRAIARGNAPPEGGSSSSTG